MTLRTVVGTATFLSLALTGAARSQCMFTQSSMPARPVIAYRFAVRGAGDSTVLGVALEFRGSTGGIDTLAIPVQWADQRLHAMRNLRALDRGVEIDSLPGEDLRFVRHAPGAEVRLSYDLIKDWTGALDHPYEFHAVIFPDYVEVTGANALVYPLVGSYTPVIVHFDWSAVPVSWALATSFGTAEGGAGSRGERCQTFIGTWSDVAESLYTAGEFRVLHFTISDKPAVLAIRGTWPYTDSAVVAEIQRDIGAVRDFWHDDNFPYFLVTWAPFDRDHGSSDGTAFANALWMFVSRLDAVASHIPTITHEGFHAWDPRRMGRVPDGEARKLVWFREGFTAFYADWIAYRAGFIPLADVVKRANRNLRAFAGSTDPYTRGDVIAWWLDGAIRDNSKNTHSLDEVMRAMVREANQPFTLERVLATADRYLTATDQATLRALVTGNGALPSPFSAGALAPCVRATLDSVYGFDAGFDVQASIGAHRVIGVREGSAAYAAGLRDGQRLAGPSIYFGDADKPAAFTILNDSTKTRISYLPRGAGSVAPQLHVISDSGVMQAGACGRR